MNSQSTEEFQGSENPPYGTMMMDICCHSFGPTSQDVHTKSEL